MHYRTNRCFVFRWGAQVVRGPRPSRRRLSATYGHDGVEAAVEEHGAAPEVQSQVGKRSAEVEAAMDVTEAATAAMPEIIITCARSG